MSEQLKCANNRRRNKGMNQSDDNHRIVMVDIEYCGVMQMAVGTPNRLCLSYSISALLEIE